jgi:hypothetical protein
MANAVRIGWCDISRAAVNKASKNPPGTALEDRLGYVQLSYGGSNHGFLGHHLGLFAAGSGVPVGAPPGVPDAKEYFQEFASHMCGRSSCIRPGHCCWESLEDNEDRKRCVVWVICPHHADKKILVCAHSPPCIIAWDGVLQTAAMEVTNWCGPAPVWSAVVE